MLLEKRCRQACLTQGCHNLQFVKNAISVNHNNVNCNKNLLFFSCYMLFQFLYVVVQLLNRDLLQPCGLQPSRFLCPWDFPGNNTGVGCLLQGIFPTKGLNPRLLHWQASLLPLSHQGSPYLKIHKQIRPKPQKTEQLKQTVIPTETFKTLFALRNFIIFITVQ